MESETNTATSQSMMMRSEDIKEEYRKYLEFKKLYC